MFIYKYGLYICNLINNIFLNEQQVFEMYIVYAFNPNYDEI